MTTRNHEWRCRAESPRTEAMKQENNTILYVYGEERDTTLIFPAFPY